MSHAHTLIRTAAVTALTGLATTAARVYGNRLYPLADADLPALRVFADAEAVEAFSMPRPQRQQRRLLVFVECCAKSNSGADDACDQMQLEVEQALYAGIGVGAKTLYPQLTGSQYEDAIGATTVAIKRIAFEINYFTLANAPDSLT